MMDSVRTRSTARILPRSQRGFTLLELLLSLALIVVATSLVGSLMSLYARSFANRADTIKQRQLARSILTMMADDIRGVVQAQPYDQSVLQGMLGASSGGSAGAAGAGAETSSGTGTAASSSAGSSSGSSSGTEVVTDAPLTSLPPGIYGSQFQLIVDVSRVPRSNEFNIVPSGVGMLTDMPGDVKSVTYLLQTGGPLGVQDSMLQVATAPDGALGANSGLVRRAIDRNVLRFAEESGTMTQIENLGDLIAPEVVAMEFSYFDGTQWINQWDSSMQGLPWLIEITLALQSPAAAEKNPLSAGVNLATLPVEDRQSYGIQVYQLTVAIPGANLQAVPANQAGGMEALGL